MKNIEQLERELEEAKQRLDPRCWKGKHKEGTKMKGGIRVNNCVPNESVSEDNVPTDPNKLTASMLMGGEYKELDLTPLIAKNNWVGTPKQVINQADKWLSDFLRQRGNMYSNLKIKYKGLTMTSSKIGDVDEPDPEFESIAEDWNKVNHHDKTNGLSQKAVNAYRREHPGSKLQTAVTTKPSKLKAGSKAAKRRKSFCARMSGNKGPMKKPNGKPTPKALALRRWNCESIEEMKQLIEYAEREIAKEKMLAEKWTQKYKNSINCSNPKGFSQKAHCAGKKK
jgi:hypothetical protein